MLTTGSRPSIVSAMKQLVVPRGRAPRRIWTGPFRGIRMQLDLTCQSQVLVGTFEREVYRWLEQFSPGIRTAIDVGACEGEYTLYFLAKTSAQQVFSFEPDLAMHPRLVSNLALNNFVDDPRLMLESTFVSDRDDNNAVSLDSLLPEISTPCLVKIDVDGGEASILSGAKDLLAREQVRWIIETHSEELEYQCVQLLRSAGYATRIIPNAWWRVVLPEVRVSETIHFNRWLAAAKDKAQ